MEPIRALGAMSGTSMDGVDAAEIWTDGEMIARFGRHALRSYSAAERATIRAAMGRWPGEAGVADAAAVVEAAHEEVLSTFEGLALIGFHGQTLAHDPGAGRTHQVGDGARLAAGLGVPVAWDFRSEDVARSGEGAPLAPAFHHSCARWIGAEGPVAFLNLGGLGNLTWVDPGRGMEAMVAFDTGPANAPIDDLAMQHLGVPFDRDGALAQAGTADREAVAALLADPYFDRRPPKSLDRDAFRAAGAGIDALRPADAAATWVAVIVETVRLA